MRYACGGLFLAICLTVSVFSTAALADPATLTMTLERPVFFIAPDETDIAAAAGTYRVQEAGPSALRLIPTELTATSAAVQIQAMTITHEEPLTSPVALQVLEEEQDDQVHLILLLPGGGGLDAVGSYSGTRSRAIGTGLSRMQVQSAVSQFRMMPPVSTVQPVPPAYVEQPAAVVRVPRAVAIVGGKFAGPAADLEDTGVIDMVADFVGPVSWGYLRMNAPEIVVGMIQEVQAGRMNANMLQGLASPDQLKALLTTKYDMQQITTRSLVPNPQSFLQDSKVIGKAPEGSQGTFRKPSTAATAARMYRKVDWASVVGLTQPAPNLEAVARTVRVTDFAPQVLAMGSLYDGQTRRGTVRIAAPKEGTVTASLPPKTPFRIVKIGAATGVFQKVTAAVSISGQVVTPQVADLATSPPFTIPVRSGQDVLVTVEFVPHFDLFSGTFVGNHQTALDIIGPNWFASVPASGRFEGIRIGVVPALESSEIDIVNTEFADARCGYAIPQALTLSNAEQRPHQVSIVPDNFPDQFSFTPFTVSLGPGQTQKVALPIKLHCVSNEPYIKTFYLGLKVRYETVERKPGFTVRVIPPTYAWQKKGELGSCSYHMELYIMSNGYRDLFGAAFNNNLVFPRGYELAVYMVGGKIGEINLSLPANESRTNRYGMVLAPLAANYPTLFGQLPQLKMRCFKRGPF